MGLGLWVLASSICDPKLPGFYGLQVLKATWSLAAVLQALGFVEASFVGNIRNPSFAEVDSPIHFIVLHCCRLGSSIMSFKAAGSVSEHAHHSQQLAEQLCDDDQVGHDVP